MFVGRQLPMVPFDGILSRIVGESDFCRDFVLDLSIDFIISVEISVQSIQFH